MRRVCFGKLELMRQLRAALPCLLGRITTQRKYHRQLLHLGPLLVFEEYISRNHFRKNAPHTPNIYFLVVLLHAEEQFGRPLVQRAYSLWQVLVVLEGVLADLAHTAEVSDLGLLELVDQDVFRLQITMHDLVFVQVPQAWQHLLQPLLQFIRVHFARARLHYQFLEVFHALFHNKFYVFFGVYNVFDVDYVCVFEFLQSPYFSDCGDRDVFFVFGHRFNGLDFVICYFSHFCNYSKCSLS